jgi:hypothetical protein
VPFGEFVPPGFGWVMRWLDIPMSDFSRGGARSRRSTSPASASRSTSATRTRSATRSRARCREATLLVNVSNVAWFGDSLAPASTCRSRACARSRPAHAPRRDQHRHHRGDRPRRRVLARCRSSPRAPRECGAGLRGTTPYALSPTGRSSRSASLLAAASRRRARRSR